MNWLNLETRVGTAPEYVGAVPVQRATWISLMLWCALQENGGRIAGGRLWGDRRWQQTCGVKRAEVLRGEPLVRVEGDDVVVWGYPAAQEEASRRVRDGAAAGARSRWGGRSGNGGGDAGGIPGGSGQGDAGGDAGADAKRNGKEGKTLSPGAGEAAGGDGEGASRRSEAATLPRVAMGVPAEAEFVEFYAALIPDLGPVVPVREYLAGRWSDYASKDWRSAGGAEIRNWQAMKSRLEQGYRNDYEEQRRAGDRGQKSGGRGAAVNGSGGNPRVSGTLNAGADYAGAVGVVGGRGRAVGAGSAGGGGGGAA